MKILKTLFLLFLFSNNSIAQIIGGEDIDASKVKSWLPKFELEYAGSYHFGFSESESTLHLFYSGDLLIGQIQAGAWEEGTGIWKMNYVNLSNIQIDKKGNFKSDEYDGQFVFYTNEKGRKIKGLKIDKPWTDWIEDESFEIGLKTDLFLKNIFLGKYPQGSYRLLNLSELENLSAEELKIMRNEIFARYGYEFKSGGEMDKYFSKQEWYQPSHQSVISFLTTIELANIALIMQKEE